MSDVFLSYSSSDRQEVEALARRLQAAGLDVFLDIWSLEAGGRWMQQLDREVREACAVLICIGATGLGPWQAAEVEVILGRAFRARQLPVIPVFLTGCTPAVETPAFLGLFQGVELRRGFDLAIRTLLLKLTPSATVPPSTGSPYRGFAAFGVDDHPLLFGREQLISQLLGLIDDASWVVVTGPSGSGKSSLVRAGVLGTLRSAPCPMVRRSWVGTVMRPGARPVHELASTIGALLHLSRTQVETLEHDLRHRAESLLGEIDLALAGEESRLLIVVDQLEELITAGGNAQEQATFLGALLAAARPGGRVCVVATLASAFLDPFLRMPAFADTLAHALFTMNGHLEHASLVEVARRPAWLAGGDVEDGVIELLTQAVGRQPGGLPLVQHTLTQLWDLRDLRSGIVTVASWSAMGGLDGSISRYCDEIVASLRELGLEKVVAQILMLLVQIGEGHPDTRRRVRADQVAATEADATALSKLVGARILTQDRAEVELTHDALLTEWTWLREMLAKHRALLRLAGEASKDAMIWEAQGCCADHLWRGERPTMTLEQLRQMPGLLRGVTERFLRCSEEQVQRERVHAQRVDQDRIEQAERVAASERARAELARSAAARTRKLAASLAAFALLSLVAGAYAIWARQTSEQRLAVANEKIRAAGNATATLANLVAEHLSELAGADQARTDMLGELATLNGILSEESNMQALNLDVYFKNQAGDLALRRGNLDEARRLYSEALAQMEQLARTTPHPIMQRELGVSYNNLFLLEMAHGREKSAISWLDKALGAARRANAELPADLVVRNFYIEVVSSMIRLRMSRGELSEAERLLREVDPLRVALEAQEFMDAGDRAALAGLEEQRGAVLLLIGDVDQARQALNRSAGLLEELLALRPMERTNRQRYTNVRLMLAGVALRVDQISSATDAFENLCPVLDAEARELSFEISAYRSAVMCWVTLGDLRGRGHRPDGMLLALKCAVDLIDSIGHDRRNSTPFKMAYFEAHFSRSLALQLLYKDPDRFGDLTFAFPVGVELVKAGYGSVTPNLTLFEAMMMERGERERASRP